VCALADLAGVPSSFVTPEENVGAKRRLKARNQEPSKMLTFRRVARPSSGQATGTCG